MKIHLFQQQVKIGSEVEIFLIGGKSVSGRFVEMTEDRITLHNEKGPVTVFTEMLGGWQILAEPGEQQGIPIAETALDTPIEAEELLGGDEVFTGRSSVSDEGASDSSSEIVETTVGDVKTEEKENGEIDAFSAQTTARAAEIEARFRENISHASLEFLPPEFAFPESEFPQGHRAETKKEWDRIKNKYDYAIKVKEFSRLNDQLKELFELAEQFPHVSEIRFNIGCLAATLEKYTEAVEAFQKAAIVSDSPTHWFNLAVAGHQTENQPLTCYALERYFSICGLREALPAWYVFVDLLPKFQNYQSLSTILESHIEEGASKDSVQLALETGVYLLKSSERQDRALSVLSEIAEDLPEASRAVALLSSILLDFPQVPASDYQDVVNQISTLQSETLKSQSVDFEEVPGHITAFYADRGFGFIEARTGKTYFFHMNDVEDDNLKVDLYAFTVGNKIPVVFDFKENPNEKYDSAVRLAKVEAPEVVIGRAKAKAKSGDLSQAIAEIKKVLRLTPENETAHQLNNQWSERLNRYTGLPKGKGAYALAKKALANKNFHEAETLFHEAIDAKDNWESAVKDLASLLQQQKRHDDAINLLRKHRPQMSDRRSVDNVLVTIYQHIGDHEKAIPILKKLLNSASNQERPTILKRIALNQYKLAEYEEAELSLREVLELVPTDAKAQRWLYALQKAKESGQYSQADLVISAPGILSEFSADISELMLFFLDRCKFSGVKTHKIASQDFSAHDIENLESLVNKLGTQRPKERADYSLSAAKILSIISTENDRGVRVSLRNFCAAMGDSAVAEQKHLDVARAFYCEALLLAPDWVPQLDVKLSQFLLSFLEQRNVLLQKVPSVKESLRRVFSNYTDHKRLLENIAIVSVVSREATERILTPILSDQKLKGIALDFLIQNEISIDKKANREDFFAAWDKLRITLSERYARMSSEYAYLRQVSVTSDSVEDFLKHLDRLEQYNICNLDSQRLNSLRTIGETMLDFSKERIFEEQERLYSVAMAQCNLLRKDIEENPTKLSIECTFPILDHLSSIVEDSFDETMKTSKPELSLELAVESCTPNRNTEIEVQLSIQNKPGCSPASNIKLMFESQTSYFQMAQLQWELEESLRGETLKTILIPMRVTTQAIKEQAFPIRVSAQYKTRGGQTLKTKPQNMTISLYPEDEFKPIQPNPYAPYAEGGPVDDPSMFFGRDELLSDLEEAIRSTESRNKCYVIYGQKRAGKSSILRHLKKRLSFPVIAVDFSIQEIETELSHTTFLYRILQGIGYAIEEEIYTGRAQIDFSLPSLAEFKEDSTIQFQQIMADLQRACNRNEQWCESRIVLLIDEFTDIYKEILRDSIQPIFMKTWKSLIERRYFGAVLVGQDVMSKFKDRFPNEFGVIQDEQITYLSEYHARQLIEKPIQLDGGENRSRYRAKAVEDILELTAGSPFYIQIICNRLIEYMNRKKQTYITDADIERVKDELITGVNSLTEDKFDNLITAGDADLDEIAPQDTLNVCRAIAEGSRTGWCSSTTIRCETETKLPEILDDLEKRKVLEKKGINDYRIRVGLFKEWLLSHQ